MIDKEKSLVRKNLDDENNSILVDKKCVPSTMTLKEKYYK
jgi:hypothetical protein